MSTKLKSPNPITKPNMKKVLLTLITFYFLGLTINAEETMYKNPSCMCCDRWVKHMNEIGFDLGITPSEKMNELKISLGIPEQGKGMPHNPYRWDYCRGPCACRPSSQDS